MSYIHGTRGWILMVLVIPWLIFYCHHEFDIFGFEWNISTITGETVMRFDTYCRSVSPSGEVLVTSVIPELWKLFNLPNSFEITEVCLTFYREKVSQVQFCISFLWQRRAHALARFRHKNAWISLKIPDLIVANGSICFLSSQMWPEIVLRSPKKYVLWSLEKKKKKKSTKRMTFTSASAVLFVWC